MACMLCGTDTHRFLFEKSGRRLLRCGACGLEWVDPMPSEAELAEYYERSYTDGSYAFFREASEVRRLVAVARLDDIDHFAPRGRWLDIGASSGDFVAAARDRGIAAEGLELSRRAVDEAGARGVSLHCSSVEDFEPATPYAMITAFDVLEHLREPRQFLRRLHPWLEPEGRLALTLPDVSSIYPRWLMGRHWFYYVPQEHLFYYSPATVTRLLEEEGFRVVQLGRASKRLTLRYAATNLQNFVPTLGRLATSAVAWLPAAIAKRGIPMYIGEMMVLAEAR